MSGTDDGGPAFPVLRENDNPDMPLLMASAGMSLRQYAAINLRVPDSGLEWLDKMIVESKRDEFAGQALAGLLARDLSGAPTGNTALQWANVRPDDCHRLPRLAYQYANTMLAERKNGGAR